MEPEWKGRKVREVKGTESLVAEESISRVLRSLVQDQVNVKTALKVEGMMRKDTRHEVIDARMENLERKFDQFMMRNEELTLEVGDLDERMKKLEGVVTVRSKKLLYAER